MLVAFFLFALDRFPLFQNRTGVARVALAKNMWMSPNQFLGDLRNDVVDVKFPCFARYLGVHDYEKQKVAEFFPKMRVVFSAGSFGDFVSFFDRRGQQRFMRLLPVPRTTARRAQFGNDVAKLLERRGFDHRDLSTINS